MHCRFDILAENLERTARSGHRRKARQHHIAVALHRGPEIAVFLAAQRDGNFVARAQDIVARHRTGLRHSHSAAHSQLVITELVQLDVGARRHDLFQTRLRQPHCHLRILRLQRLTLRQVGSRIHHAAIVETEKPAQTAIAAAASQALQKLGIPARGLRHARIASQQEPGKRQRERREESRQRHAAAKPIGAVAFPLRHVVKSRVRQVGGLA
jgi:hypothetical protein